MEDNSSKIAIALLALVASIGVAIFMITVSASIANINPILGGLLGVSTLIAFIACVHFISLYIFNKTR